jgi:hypothetical protein
MLGSAVIPVTLMYAEKVKFISFTFRESLTAVRVRGWKALPAVHLLRLRYSSRTSAGGRRTSGPAGHIC